MKKLYLLVAMSAMMLTGHRAVAQTLKADGTYDPDCVVEKWSNASTHSKIIDLNFSDTSWPCTWTANWAGATGMAIDCPHDSDGVYVNAVLDIPVNGSAQLTYPVHLHKCLFANKNAYNGYGASTAAFARINYQGANPSGNSAKTYNNWTVSGHTEYLEDNIQYEDGYAVYGEAGFVQMCRDKADGSTLEAKKANLGWVEIDHIPYVERIQWSWSSTSWGRGIKCDIKIGNADWEPLVWMGSELQKSGWTVFSDQGYFMENVIDAQDVSLRWRVWDGDRATDPVQSSSFGKESAELSWYQAPRLHKVQIFGDEISSDAAQYAYDNPVSDVGEISDLSVFGDLSETDDGSDASVAGLTAFPTAEGFGKFASGGRGGKVVTVTNLQDDANGTIEGSLRWALNQYPNDPLTVVFNVSGWIILKDELRIKRGDITIAGQTAPGEGITLYPRGLSINGLSNVIIRNIRVRCGSKDQSGNDLIADASKVDQALCAENAVNIIVDHCTFGWSAEEILNNQTSHFQTYSYNLLHEGLYDAGHHKGSARSYGAQWGGGQTTMHHNMIAHCNSRTPRFQGARQSAGDITVYNEYVNNVNFNWGSWGACYGGENDQTSRYAAHQVNFCGNYYQQGPATRKNVSTSNLKFMNASVSTQEAEWYLSDNYMDGSESVTADNSKGFYTSNSKLAILCDEFLVPTKFLTNYEFDWETYTMCGKIESAEDAFANVLANVGTINRDAIEKRIIEECATGTATYNGTWGSSYAGSGIIDDPDELTAEMATDDKGFVYCKVAAESEVRAADFDSDGDGMADEWERAHGLTVGVHDNNVLNEDGYTALEVYLNSLMGETMNTVFGDSQDKGGINDVIADPSTPIGVYYNIKGQRVPATTRGILIHNGSKSLNKHPRPL